MNINNLRPAYEFAQRFGVKAVAYGPPGKGKTPILQTAPRPLLIATEPGLLSMRRSSIPTWQAYTPATIQEFFDWFFKSNEARNFDTLGVDSGSQLCEIFLAEELGRNRDGRKAYGEMSRRSMAIFNGLYFYPEKHIYVIAKDQLQQVNTAAKYRPYFPGQDLPVKIPHLFDLVMRLDNYNVGMQGIQKAFRCLDAFDAVARDRSEQLAEFEFPNLAQIFAKAMQ